MAYYFWYSQIVLFVLRLDSILLSVETIRAYWVRDDFLTDCIDFLDCILVKLQICEYCRYLKGAALFTEEMLWALKEIITINIF